MRIGLLTDIHEAVDHLRIALKILANERIDRIVQLGDACDAFGPGRGTAAVAELLSSVSVIGVWGNHDIGFCREVPEEIRTRAEPHVLAYMAGMQPRLELADCHFSHVDPYLDPTDVLSLWMASEKPDTLEKAAPSFAAVPHRVMFLGHYHRWLVVDDVGLVTWDAASPLFLDPRMRYLVVVGPLVSGHFGVYDTDTHLLTPFVC
jgi:predicted phosphodiesterase